MRSECLTVRDGLLKLPDCFSQSDINDIITYVIASFLCMSFCVGFYVLLYVYMFIFHCMLLLCLGLLCTSCTIFIINMGVRDFLTFSPPLWGQTHNGPSRKMAQTKRGVFTQGYAFCSKNCSKNCYFSYPLIFGPLKVQIWQIFRLRKFSLDLANESDIVNRQSGGEKLKYVIKFYMGVHVTWYRAFAMTI